MLQILLGNVCKAQIHIAAVAVTGIVLQQTKDIFRINVTHLGVVSSRTKIDTNGCSQKCIAVSGLNFKNLIMVIFQTSNDDLAMLFTTGDRGENSCIFFILYMAGDIVNALRGS